MKQRRGMPERTNIWGGSFEIITKNQDQQGRDDGGDSGYDAAAYRSPVSEEEVKQSWLLRPVIEREKKRKKMKMRRYVNAMVVRTLLVVLVLAGVLGLIAYVSTRRRHHRPLTGPDNYTVALRHALMFFNAQRCMYTPLMSSSSSRYSHVIFLLNLQIFFLFGLKWTQDKSEFRTSFQ